MMRMSAANITNLFDGPAAFLPIHNNVATNFDICIADAKATTSHGKLLFAVANFDEYAARADAESLGPLTAFDLANDKEVAL